MIEIKHVTKKFGDHIILNDLNLKINDGELVAIVGKSGCGKTTLLNILGLIDTEYMGTMVYNEQNLKLLKTHAKQKFIRNNINYLFQNYALVDDMTVKKNFELALYYDKYSNEKKNLMINDALTKVGLSGYETKKVYTLSGGEQQRIALARVILKKGDIILADEPTGNLDEENRNVVLHNLLEQHRNGKTVIIVTHDSYVAEKCERVIAL